MKHAFLLYGSSTSDVNVLYFGNFFAHDPFWVIKTQSESIAIVSDLEYSRCVKESKFSTIFTYNKIFSLAEKFDNNLFSIDKTCCFIKYISKKFNINQFIVPQTFPAYLYKKLESVINISIDSGLLTNIRAVKNQCEIAAIKASCDITRKALDLAKSVVDNSEIAKNKVLIYQNEELTSERLRFLIEVECLKSGALAENTIVSCASQSADPHCTGTGPIVSNELIVVDIFPKNLKSGFFGDMTRTIFKGKLSTKKQQIMSCVKDCQLATLEQIRPGVKPSEINNFARDFFEKNGFGLKRHNQSAEGFIHSIGHGLGLALHEAPSMSASDFVLEENMVITVEPGLYYKKIGGARFEDVVKVTSSGCEII